MSCTTTNAEKKPSWTAFLEEGAEDEHKNDDFIVPDDVDSDSGNEKNKVDADTPAGERKKQSCR